MTSTPNDHPDAWAASAAEVGATLDVSLRALGDADAPIGRDLACRTLTASWPRMWDAPRSWDEATVRAAMKMRAAIRGLGTTPIRGELVRTDQSLGRVVAQRATRRGGWRWR